jgi:hypothetical protein
MGVITEYQAVVSCDYCGNNWTEAYRRQKEVIREARNNGWSVGKKVKCPECKDKNKEKIR